MDTGGVGHVLIDHLDHADRREFRRKAQLRTDVGELDQAGLEQHAHMEVEMAGVDAEPLRQLPVGQLPVAFLAEHLEHAHPEGMS